MQTGAQRGRAHGGDGVQRESLFIPGAGVVPGEHVEEMEYRERALFIPGASTVPGEHVEEVEYRGRACSFLGQVQFRESTWRRWRTEGELVHSWGRYSSRRARGGGGVQGESLVHS